MFGMGLTIHIGDFKVVFTRPKEIIIGFAAQYTIMPLIAMGTLGPPSSANGYRTWCHPGRMLPRRNCQPM